VYGCSYSHIRLLNVQTYPNVNETFRRKRANVSFGIARCLHRYGERPDRRIEKKDSVHKRVEGEEG
jgi:hypothetical protein